MELMTPLGAPEFGKLLQRAGLAPGVPPSGSFPPVFLESPYAPPVGPTRQLGWPNPEIASSPAWGGGQPEAADPLTQFKAWAATLRDGDDRNLDRLGLPPADEIKTLAADPKVHFILAKASVERLRALLDDPAVRSVNVADIAFDLGHPEFE